MAISHLLQTLSTRTKYHLQLQMELYHIVKLETLLISKMIAFQIPQIGFLLIVNSEPHVVNAHKSSNCITIYALMLA